MASFNYNSRGSLEITILMKKGKNDPCFEISGSSRGEDLKPLDVPVTISAKLAGVVLRSFAREITVQVVLNPDGGLGIRGGSYEAAIVSANSGKENTS
jgi:hypothetical protein